MRLVALAALLAATPALAQEAVVLVPGHPDLATEAVDLQTRTLDVRLVRPMTHELGTIVETVTAHDDGTVTVEQTVDLAMPGGGGSQQTRVESRFAWPSLTPVASTSWDLGDGDTGEVAFDGLRVTGSYGEDGAEPLAFDLTLNAPAFGPGSMSILARAVPLEVGYTATARTFSPDDRLEEVEVAVTGREDVAVGDATVSAVVVEIRNDGHTQRYLVDPATRALVKMAVAPNPSVLIEATPR